MANRFKKFGKDFVSFIKRNKMGTILFLSLALNLFLLRSCFAHEGTHYCPEVKCPKLEISPINCPKLECPSLVCPEVIIPENLAYPSLKCPVLKCPKIRSDEETEYVPSQEVRKAIPVEANESLPFVFTGNKLSLGDSEGQQCSSRPLYRNTCFRFLINKDLKLNVNIENKNNWYKVRKNAMEIYRGSPATCIPLQVKKNSCVEFKEEG